MKEVEIQPGSFVGIIGRRQYTSKIHYTVTLIENIESWRRNQQLFEELQKRGKEVRDANRRENAIQAIIGQNKWLEADDEAAYIDRVKELEKYRNLHVDGKYVFIPPPVTKKASFLQKIKTFFGIK